MQLEVKKVSVLDAGEIEVQVEHKETGLKWYFEITDEDLRKIKPFLPPRVLQDEGGLGGGV